MKSPPITISPETGPISKKAPGRPQRYRRPESSDGKLLLPAIDGFRGYATLTVLVTHVCLFTGVATPDRGPLIQILVGGVVDFFFVISGFVLFLPAVLKDGSLGSLKALALRRAARIIPVYYLSLLVVILAHPWIMVATNRATMPFESGRGFLSLVLHLLFLHNLAPLIGEPLGFGNGAVWTLPLEVVFYLLLPLIVRRYYRHPFLMLAAALSLSGLWWLGLVHLPSWLGWMGHSTNLAQPPQWQLALVAHAPSYFGHFALGMTAAWIFVKARETKWETVARRVAPAVQVGALAALLNGLRTLGADRIAGNPGPLIVRTPLAAWFALLMLATLMAPRWAQWPATNRLARFFGDSSYGIYLFHLPFIGLAVVTLQFTTDGSIASFLQMLAFVVAGSTLAGYLSNSFLERPIRKRAAAASRRIQASTREPVGS